MRIKITGFPTITNKEEINRIFSALGTVSHVKKKKGKNAAYVTMPYEYQARKAIRLLNGIKLLGQKICVEELLS